MESVLPLLCKLSQCFFLSWLFLIFVISHSVSVKKTLHRHVCKMNPGEWLVDKSVSIEIFSFACFLLS